MLSNPRRRGVTRLAAGSVLAATALASGAFAALGTTAAHANAYSGEYDRIGGVSWDATGAATTQAISISDLPDADQTIARVRLTLFGVTVGHVSGLHVTLNTPNGSEELLSNPTSVVGQTALDNFTFGFSSDPADVTAVPSSPGTLADEVGLGGNGDWTLSVSDDNGDAGSISYWSLEFMEPPVVSIQPTDQVVDSGTDATFSAFVDAVPAPTGQWQSSSDGGTTWNDVPDATGGTYTVKAPTTSQSGPLYRAVFTNAGGSVTTDAAQLVVNGTLPHVVDQPGNFYTQAGSPVNFDVSATADPAITSVQWEQSTDHGATWQTIPGATSTHYPLDHPVSLADNGVMYRADITNDIGTTISDPGSVTVTGQVPGKPLNVAAVQTGPGAFTIHWTAPFASGTPAMTGYQPGYSAGQMGNGEFVASSVHSDTFKGLAAGKYTASVAAVNAAGNSVRVFVPVTIVAPSATPNAHVSATRVIAGGKFVLSGVGPANATLTIKRALPGKSFVKLTTVKTNSWGAYAIKIAAMHTASYKVVTSAGKVSNKVTVVAPYAVHVLTVRTAARAYTIKGWITPAAAGRTVHITATVAGKLVGIATVTTSSTGSYKTHYKFAKKGPVTLHVHVSSSVLNAAGSTNKALTVS